jgi:hypothetical protein
MLSICGRTCAPYFPMRKQDRWCLVWCFAHYAEQSGERARSRREDVFARQRANRQTEQSRCVCMRPMLTCLMTRHTCRLKNDYALPKHLKRIRKIRTNDVDVHSILIGTRATLQAMAQSTGETLDIDESGGSPPSMLHQFGVSRLDAIFVPVSAADGIFFSTQQLEIFAFESCATGILGSILAAQSNADFLLVENVVRLRLFLVTRADAALQLDAASVDVE